MFNAMDYPARAISKSLEVVFHAVQDVMASSEGRKTQISPTTQAAFRKKQNNVKGGRKHVFKKNILFIKEYEGPFSQPSKCCVLFCSECCQNL